MNGIVNLATTIPPPVMWDFDAPGIAVLQAYGITRRSPRLHAGAACRLVAADHGLELITWHVWESSGVEAWSNCVQKRKKPSMPDDGTVAILGRDWRDAAPMTERRRATGDDL